MKTTITDRYELQDFYGYASKLANLCGLNTEHECFPEAEYDLATVVSGLAKFTKVKPDLTALAVECIQEAKAIGERLGVDPMTSEDTALSFNSLAEAKEHFRFMSPQDTETTDPEYFAYVVQHVGWRIRIGAWKVSGSPTG